MRRELCPKRSPFRQVWCQSIGLAFMFLEMALTSTLLVPGSVELDSVCAWGLEVKPPSSNQREDLHLLHHVS